MSPLRNRARWWIAGVSTALSGVALVRLVAPQFDGSVRLLVAAGGQLLALGGLFIICLGVSRRIKQSTGR
ncbi:MAG TPA: hypothetical protein VNR00_09675 [Opitutus sp.]|nr:hypothetical protein [Opitutus sp.]